MEAKDCNIINNQNIFVSNLHSGNSTLGLGGDTVTLLSDVIKIIKSKNNTIRFWEWGLKGREQWVESDSQDNERTFQSRKLDMYH